MKRGKLESVAWLYAVDVPDECLTLRHLTKLYFEEIKHESFINPIVSCSLEAFMPPASHLETFLAKNWLETPPPPIQKS